jgi:hypothetical protein
MKRPFLLRCALVLVATVCSAAAFDFQGLTGNWSGKRKELENGVGVYSNVALTAKPHEDGGLLILERGKLPEFGKYTWKHHFLADGRYKAIALSDLGLIFATSAGTWKEAGDRILISGESWNFSGNAAFKGSLRKDERKRLVYTGSSGTLRVVITGRRR